MKDLEDFLHPWDVVRVRRWLIALLVEGKMEKRVRAIIQAGHSKS